MRDVSVRRIVAKLLRVYFCLVIPSLVSCAYQKPVDRLDPRVQLDQFRAIRQGMTKQEVRRLLGSPNEVRTVHEEHLLDGGNLSEERYRWAYGASRPGSFARGGVVSFDADGRVLGAQCPISGGIGFVELPQPEQVFSTLHDLSGRVERVRFEERSGESVRFWFAEVTVTNGGDKDFARECFGNSIARLSVIEIYDKTKTMIFRDDRSEMNNGFLSKSSTFAVGAGEARTEEVAFTPDYYFGPLPPGNYYLRIYFQSHSGEFIASNFSELSVPKFKESFDQWK